MPAQFCLAMVALAGPAQAGAAPGSASHYYGRWSVSEDRPVFTARGRLYKTIDVAPCGRDFCGVSVADNGKCGAVLFRFLARNAKADELQGHGRWGDQQKNIVIYADTEDAGNGMELYLGDGHDFGERSGNMPKFHANYRRTGGARCVVR
jgi:hypothetical protein